MSDPHADLVIQISTSETAPDAAGRNTEKTEEGELTTELQRRLQPGVEIALAFPGYMAITSILWISELELDRSFRAGVRLLAVSALPVREHPEPAAPRDDAPHRAVCALEPACRT